MSAVVLAVAFQLSLRDLITGIPHDAGAIVVYVVMGLFMYGVWRGSRGHGKAESEAAADGSQDAQASASARKRA